MSMPRRMSVLTGGVTARPSAAVASAHAAHPSVLGSPHRRGGARDRAERPGVAGAAAILAGQDAHPDQGPFTPTDLMRSKASGAPVPWAVVPRGVRCGAPLATCFPTKKPRASRPRPFLSFCSFPLLHRPYVDNQPLAERRVWHMIENGLERIMNTQRTCCRAGLLCEPARPRYEPIYTNV